MAVTQFKVQGSDKPQQGQPLSPREEAIRRLKQKGLLDPEGKPMPRREFFARLGLAWLTFAAAMGGGLAALFAFMVPRVDFTKIEVFKVGAPSNFPPNTVDDSFKAAHRIWVVNDGQKIFSIWAVCTHLGCTPNWMDSEHKFKCPCHGSGYRISGINFEGPTPRPLERARIVLADDGQILVDKSRHYQWELGQWTDPEAFLKA